MLIYEKIIIGSIPKNVIIDIGGHSDNDIGTIVVQRPIQTGKPWTSPKSTSIKNDLGGASGKVGRT